MGYTRAEVRAAEATMAKYRGDETGEVGAALVIVGVSSQMAAREAEFRDDMIRIGHKVGASLRQLAEVSGLDRKTVTAIVDSGPPAEH